MTLSTSLLLDFLILTLLFLCFPTYFRVYTPTIASFLFYAIYTYVFQVEECFMIASFLAVCCSCCCCCSHHPSYHPLLLGFLCVSLIVPKLALETRIDLNSEILYVLDAGILGIYHHHPALFLYFIYDFHSHYRLYFQTYR